MSRNATEGRWEQPPERGEPPQERPSDLPERTRGLRVVLADGDPTVRGALHALLTQGLGMEVVAEAESLAALERDVWEHQPDLVVVCWELMDAAAGALPTTLRHWAEQVSIVVLGLRPEMRRDALAAGADGYISMVDAPDDVVRVLEACTARKERGR